MAKLISASTATCLKAQQHLLLKESEDISSDLELTSGILLLMKSEKLHVGEYFFVYYPDDSKRKLQTSCGILVYIKGTDIVTLRTRNGSYYEFLLNNPIEKEHFLNGAIYMINEN